MAAKPSVFGVGRFELRIAELRLSEADGGGSDDDDDGVDAFFLASESLASATAGKVWDSAALLLR